MSVASLLLCAVTAQAASITLVSQAGGTYSYGLTIDPGETFTMETAATMGLTGLSEVTGAIATDALSLFFTAGFNATQVALINKSLFTISQPGTLGTLEVTSTATTTGNVNFHITASGTVFTGTVLGPVAAPTTVVPEPSTVLLFAAGLGVILAWRARIAQRGFERWRSLAGLGN
jgi:hypothetical protein